MKSAFFLISSIVLTIVGVSLVSCQKDKEDVTSSCTCRQGDSEPYTFSGRDLHAVMNEFNVNTCAGIGEYLSEGESMPYICK